jgi:hypothetical protein
MATTLTMQAHAKSGEVFVLEYQDNEIVGLCGPLEMEQRDSPLWQYNCDAMAHEDAEWARNQEWNCPTREEDEEGNVLTIF